MTRKITEHLQTTNKKIRLVIQTSSTLTLTKGNLITRIISKDLKTDAPDLILIADSNYMLQGKVITEHFNNEKKGVFENSILQLQSCIELEESIDITYTEIARLKKQ